ncbi:MAG: SCP2 sterol-binding domain-containing protein [Cardiobacteriaceae bacterium]|nr:SCP2 sterol-binding domain-containing protein [Cardiobacteriaceae bacterium]
MPPLPDFILPAWISHVGRRLPALPPRLVLVHTLNLMLKRGVLPADMSLFAGRHFEIAVLDAGIIIRFGANAERFVASHFHHEPDLRLAANSVDYLRMMLREEDPDTLFFRRKLHIEGDTELGLVTKNLLDCVDWRCWQAFLPAPLRRLAEMRGRPEIFS